MKYISEKNTDETDAHTIDAIPGKIYLYARWIADAGGARARRDQTLQICRSGPIYAVVCMRGK